MHFNPLRVTVEIKVITYNYLSFPAFLLYYKVQSFKKNTVYCGLKVQHSLLIIYNSKFVQRAFVNDMRLRSTNRGCNAPDNLKVYTRC